MGTKPKVCFLLLGRKAPGRQVKLFARKFDLAGDALVLDLSSTNGSSVGR
jgi:hypothetical protein